MESPAEKLAWNERRFVRVHEHVLHPLLDESGGKLLTRAPWNNRVNPVLFKSMIQKFLDGGLRAQMLGIAPTCEFYGYVVLFTI